MRILVYRTGRLGDFIVAIPALQLIRDLHPAAHITLLTCASTRPQHAAKIRTYVSSGSSLPWLDFVQPSPIDEVLIFRDLHDWKKLLSLRREIGARRYDRAYILPFAYERWSHRLKKLFFLRVLGVRSRIEGWQGPRILGLSSHQVEVPLDAVDLKWREKCGPRGPRCQLNISPEARAWAREKWIELGFEGREIFAVYVGGTYAHKRWPPDRFADLCGKLAVNPAVQFLFVGSPAERAWAESIAQSVPGRHWNACGQTSLAQLAALLERCALFIGNDGGPGHLAAAMGVPCVSIMSSIYASGLWEPWGNAQMSVRHDVPCAVCQCETHCPEGTRACIDGITVAQVMQTVQIGRRKRRIDVS